MKEFVRREVKPTCTSKDELEAGIRQFWSTVTADTQYCNTSAISDLVWFIYS